MALMPQIDSYTDKMFGAKLAKNNAAALVKEIVLGLVGYTVAYPLYTASRRVVVQSADPGMQPKRYSGVTRALIGIYKESGVAGLYRGYAIYSFGMAVWLLGLPAIT
jgi:hypothetical protein